MVIRLECGLKFKKKNRHEKKKEQYRDIYEKETLWIFTHRDKKEHESCSFYPNAKNYIHRCFSTKQEASLYEMHELEYKKEYDLKLRRKRSPRNLPNSWNDFHCDLYDVEKSWKHSTKRKKQYYK